MTTNLRLLLTASPGEPDPKQRVLDYARGQRKKGEEAVAASSTLRSMRQFLRVAASETRAVAQILRNVAADEQQLSDLQKLTPAGRAEQRAQALADRDAKLRPLVEQFQRQRADVLASYPKTELPTLSDLTLTTEQLTKITTLSLQAQHMRPEAFVERAWRAIHSFDTPTAVALRDFAEMFRDDPRYQRDALKRVTGDADPLGAVLRGIDMIRTTWEHHAARIVREVVPRLTGNVEAVVAMFGEDPDGWPGADQSLSGRLATARRADGRLAVFPELDPLDGDAPSHVLDDPAWYAENDRQPPFPVEHDDATAA